MCVTTILKNEKTSEEVQTENKKRPYKEDFIEWYPLDKKLVDSGKKRERL